MNKSFVVLDVDHTLLSVNSSFLFGKELYRQKYISLWATFLAILGYGFFFLKLLSQESLHRFLFAHIFLGRSKALYQKLFCSFFSNHKNEFVREWLLQRIYEREPAELVLVSSSPDFIVEEVGKTLGITQTYGTQYCLDETGNFTSLGTVLTGKNKAAIVKKKRLSGSVLEVYTDSVDDIPLLEMADIPCVVCPDALLFRFAQKKGWTILRPVRN